MTRIVEHRNTGYSGVVTFRGTGTLNGETWTSVASTDRRSWTHSRWQVLRLVLRDVSGIDLSVASKAAAVLMCIPANETGWGRNEWNFNAVGMHCSSADAQCTEWPSDREDRRLAAYDDLPSGLRAFWRLYERWATPDERAALLRGELAGLAGVFVRVWGLDTSGGSREANASSLFRGVLNDLAAVGIPAEGLPTWAPMPEGAIARSPDRRPTATGGTSTGGTSTGGTSTRPTARRGGIGALLGLAVMAAVVIGGSKRKG